MRKVLYLVLLVLLSGCFEKVDERPINDYVQHTFVDVTYGATPGEVAEKMLRHGIYLYKAQSNERSQHYQVPHHGTVNFYVPWETINVKFNKGEMYYIRFMNSFDSKDSALAAYDSIHAVITKEYYMKDISSNDSSKYHVCYGTSESNHSVLVRCMRFKNVEGNMKEGVTLEYYDESLMPEEKASGGSAGIGRREP